jgi:hypothetical protein
MVSPTVFYKLLVPLLRCEVTDMRDSVVQALGRINHVAIMDLMSEVGLLNYRETPFPGKAGNSVSFPGNSRDPGKYILLYKLSIK